MDFWKPEHLEAWAATVLERSGLDGDAARLAASVLVQTDMRGVRTHGLSRIPAYVQNLASGVSKAKPNFAFEQTAGTIVFEADCGLGQVAGTQVVRHAVEKARSQAIVSVTIRNVGHLGALGVLLLEAARNGMMALLMQNGPRLMAPVGARQRAIGNNPLAFAAPVDRGVPLVFDMATSETAFGRILEAARAGEDIPANWALDQQGNPTTDPQAALSGILLPSAGFKGIGLSMMVECRAGVLTGTDPSKSGDGRSLPGSFGAFLLVVNPALLVGEDDFRANMRLWMSRYREAGDMAYPGERAAAKEALARTEGVDLSPALVTDLAKLGDSDGNPFPRPFRTA